MPNKTAYASCLLTLGLATVVPLNQVYAEPATLEAFTSVRFSDNMAQRSDENAEADIEYRPGIRISHVKDPGQCNSALDAELAYLIYQENTLDDQLSGEMDWDGNCEITPYLTWQASNNLQEASRDNRGTNTIENRERRNIFSTGPRLVLPLTDLDSLITSVEWQKANYEENTDNNSERWIYNARLQRQFSPVMAGWLSARYSDIEFNSGEKLEETTYRVGLSRRVTRTTFTGDIGVTTLERDVNGSPAESDGIVWNIRATHNLDNATLFAGVSRDITDYSSNVEIAFGDIRFNFDQTQAVELTTFSGGGNVRLENNVSLNGSVYFQEYQYLGSEQIEEIIGVRVGAEKSFSELLSTNARLRYERLDFQPSGATGNEYAAILGIVYQRTSRLGLGLDIGHETQAANGGGVAEYSENYIAATVTYDLR